MRFLIVAILVSWFSITCSAQKFKAGFTLGLNATDINGADTRDNDNDFSKLGVTVGGIVSTAINEKTIFQLELKFVQKGHLDKPDSLNNGYSKISLYYSEAPVLIKRQLKFNMRKKPMTRFMLECGASVGRLVNYEVIGATNYKIYSGPELFNFYDVSLLAGLGYNFSERVSLSIRYSNSVIPVIKKNIPNPAFITYSFNRGNNMVFQFAFKFVFGAVKKKEEAPLPVESNI